MRRPTLPLLLFCLLAAAFSTEAASGRLKKILPHFLDLNGHHTLHPSLYDRDAYQAFLRENAEKQSGVRFDIQWKTRGEVKSPLKLRVELRGAAHDAAPALITLEKKVPPPRWFSRWTSLPVTGTDYVKLGKITAWRATLWEGDQLLSEQKSFLW